MTECSPHLSDIQWGGICMAQDCSCHEEVVSVSADGSAQRRDVLAIKRQELTMETLGMSLAGSKALLEGVRDL